MKQHFTLIQQFIIPLALLFITNMLQAQVTLTGALSGSYATLNLAFNAINTGGGSGVVTVIITSDLTISTTAQLNQSNYTVTIQPSGTRTISGNLNTPLMLLNGASNTILDGLNTGGNTLTISNTNSGSMACAIQLQTDASNNIIQNCTLQGLTEGGFNNGVLNIRGTSGTTGCDNNQILNNKIKDVPGGTPYNCIALEGASDSVMNDNNIISNNEISNFWNPSGHSRGVYAYRYNNTLQVTGNSFFQTSARTGSVMDSYSEPIYIEDGASSPLSSGFVVSNNYIGGTAPQAGGTAYTIINTSYGAFNGIYTNLGSTTANSIQGNVIKNIHFSTAMPYSGIAKTFFTAINIASGATNIGTITGNIIGDSTGVEAILLTVNNATSGSLHGNMIALGGNNECNIKNNHIGAITTNQTGSGTADCYIAGIHVFGNDHATIENNTIGSLITPKSLLMKGGAQPFDVLQGIYVQNSNAVVKNNTVQNLVNNTGANGEVSGIAVWNNVNGKTQTCQNNIIKNISTITGVNVSVFGMLIKSSSTNNHITYAVIITGNTISECSVGAGSIQGSLFGIFMIAHNFSYQCFVNGSISDNTITNMNNQSNSDWSGGILDYQLYNGTGMIISNNQISDFSTVSGFTFGISAGGADNSILPIATNIQIERNTIQGISTNLLGSTFLIGIAFNGKNMYVSNNKIYNLKAPNSDVNSTIAGTSCDGGLNSGAYVMANNMISLGEGVANNLQIHGIRNDNSACQSLLICYNTVYIGGTTSGTLNGQTACLYRNIENPVTIKNNIFYNARTGGGGYHLALSNAAVSPAFGWETNKSNNNYLVSSNPTQLARWGLVIKNFSDWKTSTGCDGNSVSKVAGTQTNPANYFVNTTTDDLTIKIANTDEASFAQNIGTPFPDYSTDFFGTLRDLTSPDPGAFEYVTVITGVDNLTKFHNLTASPNPTTGLIQLKATDLKPGTVEIKVFDQLGSVITIKPYQVINGQISMTLDLSSFTKGLYFIQLTNDSEVWVEKVMVL